MTDLIPLARATDPVTSHEAAEKIKAASITQQRRDFLAQLVFDWPGETSAELAKRADGALGLDYHETARRLSDLNHQDRARRDEPRKCKVRGTECVTWWPTFRQGEL